MFKYDISRRESWTVVIFGILLYPIESRSKVIWGHQTSNCENLTNTIYEDGETWRDLMFSIAYCMLTYHMIEYRSLLLVILGQQFNVCRIFN